MTEQEARIAWLKYDSELRKSLPRSAVSDTFDRDKLARGVLTLPTDAASIVVNSERVEFWSDSTEPGHKTHKWSDAKERDIKASSHFRVIAGPIESLLTDCVAQLRDPVAEQLGSPWRIHNTRAWTTPTDAVTNGMYKFHLDGFPEALFKIMIYFTPMDHEHGALEVRCRGRGEVLTGPAGSWVLFYNSTLLHRGCPGTTSERASAEITLSRSREFDLALYQPGLNAHWPLVP